MKTTCDKETEQVSPLKWWVGGVSVVLALMLAIRPESFWIDELSSAFLAAQSDWQRMILCLGDMGSEAQMPLHVAWLWLWARFFGTGEWALRASNIPWAILATFAWVGLLRKRTYGVWALGLLISPFVCYYMNEARPYAMTFATGMLALYAVESLCAAPAGTCGPQGTIALVAGLGLCAGASMLNLILVPSLMAYAAMRLSGGVVAGGAGNWVRCHKGTLGCLGVLLVCMAGYYFLTLMHGHGGQWAPFTWINAAYSIYEMLGFGGLGAPRILLRELSVAGVLSQYGVTLFFGLAVWIWVAWVVWAQRRDVLRDPIVRAAITSLAVGFLLLVLAAIFGKASLWGRHFMVMMPLLLWGVANAMETVRKGSPLAAQFAIFGLIGLFAVSSIRQRGLDDYRKDPLREAMAELGTIVRRSPDMPVVVVTCPLAVRFYGCDATPALTQALGWSDAKAKRWQSEHPAYVLLMHRADKFDPNGVWSHSLLDPKATLLWRVGNIKIYRVGQTADTKGIL